MTIWKKKKLEPYFYSRWIQTFVKKQIGTLQNRKPEWPTKLRRDDKSSPVSEEMQI